MLLILIFTDFHRLSKLYAVHVLVFYSILVGHKLFVELARNSLYLYLKVIPLQYDYIIRIVSLF